MDIKLISFVFILLSLQSCISKECKDAPNLDFELLVNYFPVQDTFNVGDTLYIQSEFSDMLYDPGRGIVQEVVDFNLYTNISFSITVDGERIPINLQDEQIINIDVEYVLRAYSDNSEGLLIDKHQYDEETYSFSFGIILNKTGTYYFNNRSDLGDTNATSGQRFEGQCSNQELGAFYKVNNGDAYENGFGFIKNKAPYEAVRDFNFNMDGGFAFYVKE